MVRFLVALSLVGLLSACQAGTEYYGKGPLVLSEKAEAVLRSNIHGENGIRENLVIAIDRRLRRMGGVYCPSSDIHACISGGSLSASQAVDNCNKDDKYDCWVYSIVDRIVWQGPVFVRDAETGQRLPYHGVWPVSLEWDGVSVGGAQLIADQGEARLAGTTAGTCLLNFRPADREGGDVGMRCESGLTAGGDYSATPARTVAGEGKDSKGRAIRFELDLDRGQGAPGAPNT